MKQMVSVFRFWILWDKWSMAHLWRMLAILLNGIVGWDKKRRHM